MSGKYSDMLARVKQLAQEAIDGGHGGVASIALCWPDLNVRVTPNEVLEWTRYPQRGDFKEVVE